MVIPVLFCHDPSSPYPRKARWQDCFINTALAQALYCRIVMMVDLKTIPNDEITLHGKAGLMWYVQKNITEEDINDALKDVAGSPELSQFSNEQMACLIHSLAQEAYARAPEGFSRHPEENTTGYKETMMTFAEHLEQEGHKNGRQEGLVEGLQLGRHEGRRERGREIANNMLALGLDRTTIALVTGLSSAELDGLMNAEL